MRPYRAARVVLLMVIMLSSWAVCPALRAAPKSKSPAAPIVIMKTKAEFLAWLASSKRIIVHLDVAWSIEAKLSERVVGRFHAALADVRDLHDVDIRTVDVTGGTPPSDELRDAVHDWLHRQGQNTGTAGGTGDLVLVDHGRIVGVIEGVLQYEVDDLIRLTRAAYAAKPARATPPGRDE